MKVRELPNTPADLERSRSHSNFAVGTLTSITVWHDYICPWCWVALFQAKKLTEQFGVTFDWRGCELMPAALQVPASAATQSQAPAPTPVPSPEPKPKSRFDLFVEAEGVPVPKGPGRFTGSHAALLGTEYAREHGDIEAFVEGVYRAYWERQKDISDIDVLRPIAVSAGMDADDFALSIHLERYHTRILPFDDEAYAWSIRHAPTFIFGGAERLAEAHYDDLARATERFLLRADRIRRNRGLI